MMRKSIKIKDEVYEFTLEETMVAFEKMILKFGHKCVSELERFQDSVDDFDDYVQIGRMELINAYNKYNVGLNVGFSTYLTKALNNRMLHLIRDIQAGKRNNGEFNLCLNKTIDDGVEIADACKEIAEEDKYFASEESELEKFLKRTLSEQELLMLSMYFRKQIGKAKGEDKKTLFTAIDILEEGTTLASDNITKSELADMLGLSRPTLNKKINETVKKTQDLVIMFVSR